MQLSDDQINDYRALVDTLREDLNARVDRDNELEAGLRESWQTARDKDRTADNFSDWLERYTDQIAVAWVLTAVFTRYLEDNGLVERWLAGASGDSDQAAVVEDNERWFFSEHPTASETDYLLHVFGRLADMEAGELFREGRNPLYRMRITGDGAQELLEFFRKIDPDTGELQRGFDEAGPQTRFLGDLYQDLSVDARKRYALLQTPEFVEEFILDLTLDPALEEFGLYLDPQERIERTGEGDARGFRFIDPTCGSGHFLLGGFRRILDRLQDQHPEQPRAVLVRRALETVHGVDINPFAVSIARFRLLVAALHELGDGGSQERQDAKIAKGAKENREERKNTSPIPLSEAPSLPIYVGTGDALIQGRFFPRFETGQTDNQLQGELGRFLWDDRFSTEDADLIYGTAAASHQPSNVNEGNPKAQSQKPRAAHEQRETGILTQQYHAVVGNPPYITPKDKAQNAAYREFYDSCHRHYSLVCPFYERFFQLAGGERLGDDLFTDDEDRWSWSSAGYIGAIVSKSFMRRNFGTKLVEEIFPHTDLTYIIDTSGAKIPGHNEDGTPTVTLSGRNRIPTEETVRVVASVGRHSTSDNAQTEDSRQASRPAWDAIRSHIHSPGTENRYVSTFDMDRGSAHHHPLTIVPKSTNDLLEKLNSPPNFPIGKIADVGISGMSNAKPVFEQKKDTYVRNGVDGEDVRRHIIGSSLRDWTDSSLHHALFPYSNKSLELKTIEGGTYRFLWTFREFLWSRAVSNGGTYKTAGREWYRWHRVVKSRYTSKTSIVYPLVATRNHFTRVSNGSVFKHSAPVVKLTAERPNSEYTQLLGPLNSPINEFWQRQTFYKKSTSTEGYFEQFERDTTKMAEFPVPADRPVDLPRRLDGLGQQLADLRPRALTESAPPTAERLDEAREESGHVLRRMIALQEELDWRFYGIYGLSEAPPLAADFVPDDAPSRAHDAEAQSPNPQSRGETANPLDALPEVKLGERAFEIVLARKMEAGDVTTSWFERHGSTPRTDIPERWPEWYRDLVRARIERIDGDDDVRERFVKLIEVPEFKRRWNLDDREDLEDDALEQWLGDRLETPRYFPRTARMEGNHANIRKSELVNRNSEKQPQKSEHPAGNPGTSDDGNPKAQSRKPKASAADPSGPPELRSVTQLAHEAAQDELFLEVGERYTGDPSFDVEKLVEQLVLADSVPYLPTQRHTTQGLRRRKEWEDVWELQRREDEIDARTELPEDDPDYLTEQQAESLKEKEVGDIPKPPKYRKTKDYKITDRTWPNRGKLDVPKERFTEYPGLGASGSENGDDKEILVTWAGLDHLERARALATHYYKAKDQWGWAHDPDLHPRLTQILAGLKDLLPWVNQWHPEPDPSTGEPFGDFLERMIRSEATELGVGLDAVDEARIGGG